MTTRKYLDLVYNYLAQNKLIKSVDSVNRFYDEPPLHYYSISLAAESIAEEFRQFQYNIKAGGTSIFSAEKALFKALVESVERMSLFNFNPLIINRHKLTNIPKYSYDITNETLKFNKIKNIELCCVTGFDLTNSLDVAIPAQSIYMNYHIYDSYQNSHYEPLLAEPISTGAAAGFDHESTLLRGICEVIERDAAMSVYLGNVTPPEVEIKHTTDYHLRKLVKLLEDYNLHLRVFDVTNDLQVPTYISCIMDTASQVPAFSFASKCSWRENEAIIGSIEECLMTRIWTRGRMIQLAKPMSTAKTSPIIEKRLLLWASKRNKNKKLTLINNNPVSSLKKYNLPDTESAVIKEIIRRLDNKGHTIVYSDITMPQLKELGLYVYKVIISGLQVFYMEEAKKVINRKRIMEIQKYFGQLNRTINNYPHPFA